MRIPYNGQSGVFSSLLSNLPRRLPCALSAELLARLVGSCPRRLSAQASHSPPTHCRPPAGDPARSNPQGNARPRWQQGRLQYTLKQGTTTTYPAYIKTLSVPTLPGSYSYHIITQHKVGYINRDIHRADTHSIR